MPASAAGAVRLVLPTASLPGLRATPTSEAAALADLARGLPARLRALADGALAQTSAARGSGLTLRSDAFVFGSRSTAARVLAAWRRARGARAAGFGYEAGAGRAFTIAWRAGARIGVIALSASRRVRDPRGVAERYAVLADVWLRSPLPSTAWGRVLAQIRPNGTVSKATALEAFSVVYGPLPGVRRPPGRRVAIPSGTLAEEWIMSYFRRLTRPQQKVVERLLGVRVAGRRARVADYDDPGFQPTAKIQSLADTFVNQYAGVLPHALGLKVVGGETTTVVTDPKNPKAVVLADAAPFNAQGDWGSGTPATCRVRVTPAGDAQNSAFLGLLVAHEVFHCFQFDILGSGAWAGLPAWIGEGTADWAALSVDPVSFQIGGGNLKAYLFSPQTPLFERSYDAVGFWGHADDVVPGLFKRMATIFNAGSNAASFNFAVGSQDAFLSSWGSSPFRANGIAGAPWQMHSPIDPPAYGVLPLNAQSIDPSIIGGNGQVGAPPFTTAQYLVKASSAEPVLHVVIHGHARLGLQENYTDLQDAWLCTSAGECFCPSGTTGSVPPTLPLNNGAALALSGDPDVPGTYGDLTSYPLSEFCHPKQPQPSPGSGNPGTSNGDPYIGTFDGGAYGFQTAGEFTLMKSIADNLEVQSRQVPYPSTLLPGISQSLAMNTAFAMRDGGAIVEVDKGSPLVLYINHRRRFPARARTIALAGGGRVRYFAGHVLVRWRDGTLARVYSIGDEGVNIAVMPSAKRAGLLRGLLGSDDGHLDDDFIGRNGHRYSAKQIQSVGLLVHSAAQVRIVLGGFGRSWRITQRESLFVYPRGKNTRSYLVPGFPRVVVSLFSLPRHRLLAAQRACHRAGVTNATLLVGCEIDYGATGDGRLATGTGRLQHGAGIPGSVTTPGISPVPWTQLSAQIDRNSSLLLPTVAFANPAAGTVVAAYQRFASGSIESDTFHAGTGGISAVARQTPITGWVSVGNPVLFGAPGGGLQMIFSGVHTDQSDPLTGTLIAPRAADGSYGTAVRASSQVVDNIGGVSGAVLASDGSTPLWAAAQDGALAVYRGASNATANDLTPQAAGRSYNPALAYDKSGRLWIAWYMVPQGSSQAGLYMMQLDPATGASAGPALHVPSSDGVNYLDEGRPALACAQACRVVYNQGTKPTNLLSWAPGDASPALVFAGAERIPGSMPGSPLYPHSPSAAYTSGGRLWVAWRDNVSYLKMYAKLGNATGTGGNVVTLQVPAKNATPEYSSSLAIGNSLAVVGNWSPGNLGPTSVWGTVVNPS